MKKILLIIPLLIWVACEDDNNDNSDYSFVNEWVNCKQLSYKVVLLMSVWLQWGS
jgi:hypothetical protein